MRAARARPLHVLLAALVAAPLAAAGLVTAGVVGPAPRLAHADEPAPDVSVDVASLQPVAPTAADVLRVSGTVRNESGGELDNLSVQLRLGTTPVQSRAELAAQARDTGRPPGDVRDVVRVPQPLAAGAGTPYALSTPLATAGLGGAGVYPLTVEVIADDPATGERIRVGTARTWLPWAMQTVSPTTVALLWPLVATPARTAAGVPVDDQLHHEVAGRLTRLLDAVGTTRATWLVDGDTLEGVRDLAVGPPNRAGAATPRAAPDPTAAQWLARVDDLVGGADVRALPYADPDLAATVRGGLAGDLRVGTVLGQTSAEDVLRGHVDVRGALAWPADGSADARTLASLQGAGLAEVLLSARYAPPVVQRPWTSSAAGPLAGTPLTAVVVDGVLTGLVAAPPAQQGGAVLARQRLLAETAMVSAELPSVPRSVVVLPPRSWDPDVAYVRAALGSLADAPWVRLGTLADVTATAADGPARARPSYPASLRAKELPAAQLAQVRRGHARLDALAGVLAEPVALQDSYGRALLRSESVAWRALGPEGLGYARTVVSQLGTLQGAVRIIPPGAVTLAARSGRIPVTVENGLDQPVTLRVTVQVVPSVRLSVSQPGAVTVPAHGSTTLDVGAEATTNGSVRLVARLVRPDGRPYGPPVSFAVQITGFGAVATVVVAAALVLLAVALVVRVVRAVRHGRRPGSGAAQRELVR